MIFGNTIGSSLLQSVGGKRHPETRRSVYTLSHRLEYLQRRKDTFSFSSLLAERPAAWAGPRRLRHPASHHGNAISSGYSGKSGRLSPLKGNAGMSLVFICFAPSATASALTTPAAIERACFLGMFRWGL